MICSNVVTALLAETMESPGNLGCAIALAATAHAGQCDKAGQPYILHPLRVMAAMDTEEERIVAVLHDALEDCPAIAPWTIQEIFGQRIYEAVGALTHSKDEDYLGEYIPRVNRSELTRKVKIADLYDNLDPHRLRIRGGDMARVLRYHRALEMLA